MPRPKKAAPAVLKFLPAATHLQKTHLRSHHRLRLLTWHHRPRQALHQLLPWCLLLSQRQPPMPTAQSTMESQTQSDSEAISQSMGGTDSGGGNSNFDTYDNTEQQQTTDTYVLNTSSMKIHHPSCSSVPKIAPQNYGTSSESIDDLRAKGYSTCGICFK